MAAPVPEWAPSAEWGPTPEEIAALIPAYTRGGFDDDDSGIYPGAPQGAFTDTTSPTLGEVRALIDTSTDEVTGRVGVIIPAAYFNLAKATVKWHVCMTIAQNKMPANADEAGGQYRAFNSNFVASLAALTDLSRKPSPTRLR